MGKGQSGSYPKICSEKVLTINANINTKIENNTDVRNREIMDVT